MSKKTLAIIVVVVLILAVGIYAATRKKGLPNEIVIGTNFEMTGTVASFGTSSLNGVELAVDEANAAGELKSKIVLAKADNKSDAAEAANMARKLIEQDKAVVLIGPVTSGNSKAAGQVAQENKIPMISPTATAVDVTTIGNYIFRACFLDDFQGKAMADFSYNTLNSRKAAILYAKNDYAEGLAKFFKERFIALGGTVVAEEAFQDGDTDFKAQLTKIKNAKPDSINIPGYYNEQGLITRQARQMGITMPLTGGDGWDSDLLTGIAGAANLNSVYYTNHYSPTDPDPMVQSFVNAYKAKYGSNPDALAALGYEATKIVIDSIKRANSVNPDKIRQAMADTKDFKALSATISFDENRNPVKGLVIVELKNGERSVREFVNP